MAKIAGIFGLVLFGFGFIGWMLTGFPDLLAVPLVLGHLVLGAVLIAVWFLAEGASNIGSAGEIVRGRTSRFGAFATINISLFVALLAGVNWLAAKYDRRADLTKDNVYSLAPQSASIIENLKKPLKIVALLGVNGGRDDEDIKDRLKLYADAGKKVATETIDVRTKPQLIEKYEMKQGNVVYLAYGEGEKIGVSRLNDASEEAITNGVLKLTRGEAKKIYYVVGHDEPTLNGQNPGDLKKLSEAINDEHLTIEEIFLAEKSEVPADAAAVVLVSPKKALLAQERDILTKYADNGGHLLLLADPRTTSDISEIAKHFDIEVGNDVVIDFVQRLFDAPALGAQPLISSFATHPITQALARGSRVIFNIASSVSAKGKDSERGSYTSLLSSGSSAWAETSLDRLFDQENGTAELEDGDIKGPVSMAIAYEHKIPAAAGAAPDAEPKTTRVVVFGDADWIVNANLGVLANRDLILNAINWVAGEEGGVSLRPRSLQTSTTPIGDSEFKQMLLASFLIPEVLLLVGLLVWWARRTRPSLA